MAHMTSEAKSDSMIEVLQITPTLQIEETYMKIWYLLYKQYREKVT